MKRITSVTALLLLVVTTSVLAHTMMFKGTVAAIETKRIQLKTGEEKKGEAPAWFEISARTKILREKTMMTLEQEIRYFEQLRSLPEHAIRGCWDDFHAIIDRLSD